MSLLIERYDGRLVDYRMAACYAVILMFLDLILLDLEHGIALAVSIAVSSLFTLAAGALLFNHNKTIDKPYTPIILVAANLGVVVSINTLT